MLLAKINPNENIRAIFSNHTSLITKKGGIVINVMIDTIKVLCKNKKARKFRINFYKIFYLIILITRIINIDKKTKG